MPFKGTGICEVLGTGYMDTKLSGRFLPPMPAVLGFEYGLHSQLPHPQDLRTDPPHHSCYCSNSTVRTLPSKPFCPFYVSVYWNHHSWLHISLHYKPVLTVTIPKVNSTVRFPFSFSFSCRILACITVSWGALGVGARSLDPAQGNSHICTPTGTASLCPLLKSKPTCILLLSLLQHLTSWEKWGLAQNFLIFLFHLKMFCVLSPASCFSSVLWVYFLSKEI